MIVLNQLTLKNNSIIRLCATETGFCILANSKTVWAIDTNGNVYFNIQEFGTGDKSIFIEIMRWTKDCITAIKQGYNFENFKDRGYYLQFLSSDMLEPNTVYLTIDGSYILYIGRCSANELNHKGKSSGRKYYYCKLYDARENHYCIVLDGLGGCVIDGNSKVIAGSNPPTNIIQKVYSVDCNLIRVVSDCYRRRYVYEFNR